jgi:hypothetical protein
MKRLVLLILILSLIYPYPIFATDFPQYEGDYHTWWIPTARPSTFYVAEGDHGTVVLVKSLSGTDKIAVVKATDSAHGPAAGWVNGDGDAQAVFTKFTFWTGTVDVASGYFEIDGVTGSGQSGHGIKIGTLITGDRYPLDHITLKHIEVSGASLLNDTTVDALYLVGVKSNLLVDTVYLHNVKFPITVNDIDTFTIQDSYIGPHNAMADQRGGTGHGQTIQIGKASAHGLIQRSVFRDCEGQAIVTVLGNNFIVDDLKFINNLVFYSGDTLTYSIGTSPLGFAATGGLFSCLQTSTCTNIKFLNNTVVNITGANAGAYCYTADCSISFQNMLNFSNIASPAPVNFTNATPNTNWYSTGTYAITTNDATNKKGDGTNPFTNSATFDFSLIAGSSPRTGGINLSATFTDDRLKVTRSNWSLGAEEYTGTIGNTTIGTGAGFSLGVGAASTIQ